MTNYQRIMIVLSILALSTVLAFFIRKDHVQVSLNQSLAAGNLPVVPGGFGYGMNTRAAYGCGIDPVVLRVKNLNDDGADSLRAALEDSRPRVVVFETSGTIILNSDIDLTSPCITIAGQTAPSPGITIRGADNASVSAGGINVYTHDVLIQHLRIRPGDGGPVLDEANGHDAVDIYQQPVYNVVLDHNSMSWTGGKISFVYNTRDDAQVNYWQNIMSEALYHSKNASVTNGTNDWSAAVSGINTSVSEANGSIATTTLYGNLFAHNTDRNPQIGQDVQVHFINNVVYDWGNDPVYYTWATFFYAYSDNTRPFKMDIIGNTYIAGPATPPNTPLFAVGVWSGDAGSQVYLNDNLLDATAAVPINLYDSPAGSNYRASSPTLSESGFNILPGSSTKSFVLAHAGARPADRDSVDTRIVSEVSNRTGSPGTSCPSLTNGGAISAVAGRICSQSDVGGWPTLAVNTRAFITPANPNTYASNGYTNLENTLHAAADLVEGTSGANPPPPPPGPTPSPSPSGTRIPTASAITDSSGNIWTLGSGSTPNIVILRNGSQAAGAFGAQILWYNNILYIQGDDLAWYQWNGTYFSFLGSSDPSGITPLAGDLNQDHIINSLDWSIMNSKWFSSDANADLNHDGLVNAIDFSMLNSNWFKTW